jgi:hypothetical protein
MGASLYCGLLILCMGGFLQVNNFSSMGASLYCGLLILCMGGFLQVK